MKAKQKLIVSLVALSSAAALVGCGGSSTPSSSYPKGGGYSPEPMAAEDASGAPAPASEPGTDMDVEAAEEAAPAARSRQQAPRSDGAALEPAPEKETRPGLATQWGEQRFSRVTTAPFMRADRMSPFAVEKLFYNDAQGIAAMSDTLGGGRDHTRRFPIGAGHVEIGLRDSSGRFLTGFSANGNDFVTGASGRRYTIFIKNHSPGRIEVVVSVDGLDVIDGKAASFSKRGYLLDPFGDLEIEGFRTSNNEVAAFRFGSVQNSYANKKHGDTRNVGVIGVALFHERGDSPRFWGTPRSHGDVVRRSGADPFPNRFASPPN